MRVKLTEKEVLNPLGVVQEKKVSLNPLPYDFDKVSLVDNTKPGADIILNVLQESLGNREFIKVQKPAGAPATPEQLKRAASTELAILALGDCGSCTSWVIMDAIRLENKGIPAISICSHRFTPFARELAKSHGLNELRILEIEHPISGLSEGEIRGKTEKIIPKLQYILQIP